MAWILRFTRNAENPSRDGRRKGQLGQDDVLEAEKGVPLAGQKREYPLDLQRLRQSEQLLPSSSLHPLAPIIEDKGIMRVGGRPSNAPLTRDTR